MTVEFQKFIQHLQIKSNSKKSNSITKSSITEIKSRTDILLSQVKREFNSRDHIKILISYCHNLDLSS